MSIVDAELRRFKFYMAHIVQRQQILLTITLDCGSSDFETYIGPGKVHISIILKKQVIPFTSWTLKPKKKYIQAEIGCYMMKSSYYGTRL